MKSIAPRALDPAEAAVVRSALINAPLGIVSAGMIQEVENLSVVGICDCGCHSLYFSSSSSEDYRVADGVGYLANGKRVGVMVWARHAYVTALELVDHQGSGELPSADSVCSWEKAGRREANRA